MRRTLPLRPGRVALSRKPGSGAAPTVGAIEKDRDLLSGRRTRFHSDDSGNLEVIDGYEFVVMRQS
jgi:hypothetical protein